MKSGSDFSVWNRTILPDGSIRWLSDAGRIHLDEHSEPTRGVGITQDVTEQKRAEARVKTSTTRSSFSDFAYSRRR
jgi:PAS domain S-box-containing protein